MLAHPNPTCTGYDAYRYIHDGTTLRIALTINGGGVKAVVLQVVLQDWPFQLPYFKVQLPYFKFASCDKVYIIVLESEHAYMRMSNLALDDGD
jgi:hypothetical protein